MLSSIKVTKAILVAHINLKVKRAILFAYSFPFNKFEHLFNLTNHRLSMEKKKDEVNQEAVKSEISTKNKWLYTSDSFGKMERGVVDHSDADEGS